MTILSDTLVIFLAASLNKPMQPVLERFTAATGIVVQRESAASLEHVRKVTELHRLPDVLLLADAEVFPQYLVPRYATWYAQFARNRMVVAYTDHSKHAAEITPANWTRIVTQPDVEIGRTDPDLAPVGYRTLMMFQLAERFYGQRGLARALLDHAPPRNIRPNAAELAALLAAGELDYIYDYLSVAESNGFHFIPLPSAVNLSDPARAAEYRTASVRVRGATRGTQTTLHGQPILYGLSVPTGAPHPSAAVRFLSFLFSAPTVAALRRAHVDMLEHAVIVGRGAPAELRGTARR